MRDFEELCRLETHCRVTREEKFSLKKQGRWEDYLKARRRSRQNKSNAAKKVGRENDKRRKIVRDAMAMEPADKGQTAKAFSSKYTQAEKTNQELAPDDVIKEGYNRVYIPPEYGVRKILFDL